MTNNSHIEEYRLTSQAYTDVKPMNPRHTFLISKSAIFGILLVSAGVTALGVADQAKTARMDIQLVETRIAPENLSGRRSAPARPAGG